MALIILISLLLFTSWFFSEVLVLIPLHFLDSLKSVVWWGLVTVFTLIFIWCFGD